MMTFLIALVVFGLLWLGALELRYHNLKNINAESKALADEAIAYAEGLLKRFHIHVDAPPPAKPKAKK